MSIYLARSRHWRDTTVGAEAVHEFHRVMAARHAAGGSIVTSGSFSPEARELARERQIELLDGEQLVPLAHGAEDIAHLKVPFACLAVCC